MNQSLRPIKISIITSLYNSRSYLKSFIKNFLEISNIYEVELVIIHNGPTSEETQIIKKYAHKIPNLVYQEVELEGLYESWNRAIKLSSGEYLAMWSVDDRRVPDSLVKQADLLDNNKECMIVTGNYYKVFNYGDTEGYLKKDPIFNRKISGITKFNNGCFLMWRKKLHKEIGYFDEQLSIIADHDFWIRATLNFCVKSTNSVLGYFLREAQSGLSKRNIKSNNIQLNIVKLRYYRYFIFNPYLYLYIQYISDKHQIELNKVKCFGLYYENISVRKPNIISIILSLFLFWLPLFKKRLVEFNYKLLEHNGKKRSI